MWTFAIPVLVYIISDQIAYNLKGLFLKYESKYANLVINLSRVEGRYTLLVHT